MRQVDGTKVTRLTLGGLPSCLVLPAPQGVGMGRQKSAEARAGRRRLVCRLYIDVCRGCGRPAGWREHGPTEGAKLSGARSRRRARFESRGEVRIWQADFRGETEQHEHTNRQPRHVELPPLVAMSRRGGG